MSSETQPPPDSFCSLYSSSLFILISILFSSYLLIYDNSPPVFPLPASSSVLDCSSVRLNYIYNESSRLKLGFHIGDFIEYPQNVASSLIHIVVKSGGSIVDFEDAQFWDMEINGSNLTFCIIQTFGGFNHADVFCQDRKLGSFDFQIPDTKIYPVGYSKSISAYDTISAFSDVCYSDGSLVFLTASPKTYLKPMRVYYDTFSNKLETIQIVPKNEKYIEYSEMKNKRSFIEQKTTLMISAHPPKEDVERLLYEVLVPIWGAVVKTGSESDYKVAYTRNQTYLHHNVKAMIKRPLVSLNKSKCFEQAQFLRTVGSSPYGFSDAAKEKPSSALLAEHFQWLLSYSPSIFPKFKSFFTNVTAFTPGRIVVTQGLAELIDRIKKFVPNSEIIVFPTKTPEDEEDNEESNRVANISEVASIIASANIFIADRLESLLFAMFMSKEATLLEVHPRGMECTTYGKRFAKFGQANYASLFDIKDQKCSCSSVACYFRPDLERNEIKDDFLQHFLEDVLLTSEERNN